MDNLKKYFESQGFTGEDLDKILKAFQLKEFKKSDLFAEYGQSIKHLGYVESGMFQYYILDKSEETTTYVATENTFIASLLGFFNDVPAQENIRALIDGRVWLITKNSLLILINEIPKFKDFYIAILEWHICAIDRSRNELIMLTAEQRYDKMLSETPHLLEHIPLQYIAAILGVTPRHLSRIRKIFT
jgi:CRP/FNR family transcriptional regulator, anaerobic regulatory protein